MDRTLEERIITLENAFRASHHHALFRNADYIASITDKEKLMDQRKTLSNTTASKAVENVRDLKTWGDPDTWKLICKASSKREGWMKSTKAMEIPGLGCLVQVTTQQGDHVAEALCFVPGVQIVEGTDESSKVEWRKLGLMPGAVVRSGIPYSEVGENPYLTIDQQKDLEKHRDRDPDKPVIP